MDLTQFRATYWNRVKAQTKTLLGHYPKLYHAVFRSRDGHEDRLVDEQTDICIEGFPRSANSFAVGAFRRAQDDPVNIAHHNHVPAPVLRAARWGLPTVVLIRHPVDAVISNTALQLQNEARGGTPVWIPGGDTQLESWITYYEQVWPHRDHVVIGPFEAVVEDYGAVIESMFGESSDPAQHQVRHRQSDHRFRHLGLTFVVARQTPISAKPSKRSFYDPTLRQRREALLGIFSAYDAEHPVKAPPH
ncbi:hypothetical protein GGP62_003366 [Salinibacter ruber]|nr:hypothetical protein [Salinibacter ruber]MCS3708344.1 hypothetical protein [Salinibacter ruber]